MFDIKIVLIVSLLINVSYSNQKFRRLARIDRLVECDTSNNSALHLMEVNIVNPPGQNVILSLTAELNRELRAEPKMEAHVYRCLSKEALDTCVPFTVLKPFTTCGLIAMDNMAWSEFVNSVIPPLKCPFRVGKYELKNGTFDPELFKFFPIDNFYWRAKIYFKELDAVWGVCVDVKSVKYFH